MLSAYGRQIHGVAYLVLHSTGDAEEVVMDTLLTAWDKAGSLRDPEALKPWLMRIATRHSLTKVRRSRRVDPIEDLDPGISRATPGPGQAAPVPRSRDTPSPAAAEQTDAT